jgi:hypothetical protein
MSSHIKQIISLFLLYFDIAFSEDDLKISIKNPGIFEDLHLITPMKDELFPKNIFLFNYQRK